jgi:antitoxin YefM
MTRIMVNYNWSQIMKTLSLSEAKMKFSSIVDMVSSTDEEIVITKNGRPAAIIISPDVYESIKETANIRSDAALMEEISRGLNSLKAKRAQVFTLDEL